MDGAPAVKTMKLRHPGVCVGCETALPAGTRSHYLPPDDDGPLHQQPPQGWPRVRSLWKRSTARTASAARAEPSRSG